VFVASASPEHESQGIHGTREIQDDLVGADLVVLHTYDPFPTEVHDVDPEQYLHVGQVWRLIVAAGVSMHLDRMADGLLTVVALL
jgi:hypothetical protein